jgi:hypothetical protein
MSLDACQIWLRTYSSAKRTTRVNELEMTMEELLALPVSVSLLTAGRAFGLGRTKAHEMAKAGEFPCRVLRVGNRYRVPRTAIFEALGINSAGAIIGEPQPAA